MRIREKKHRLDREFYQGRVVVTFTALVKHRQPVLCEMNTFKAMIDSLEKGVQDNLCKCIYTFIPDHTHIVMFGDSDQADTYKAMVDFKQQSGYWFSQNRPSVRWQKDFYDHIHRSNEDLNNQILYVLNNPVRRGVVKYWWEYSYSGSTGFDWDKIVERFRYNE
ncbi:MAG: hypothetical protein H8E82_04565 [Candidatus Marinimicrobia bacterium]|nr:hypothetical protein [Candidatus Neomarinimicrobiota bacterium]MBL7046154.1 hypothetical protein [Candidatus Neomarinimicrobiota bacterium]